VKNNQSSNGFCRNYYVDVEVATQHMVYSLMRALRYEKTRHQIVGFTENVTPIGKKWSVIDNKGSNIVQISSKYDDSDISRELLLETPSLNVSIEYDKQVKMSEHMSGIEGVLSEITYTPKGKQILERGKQPLPILSPITLDDVESVQDRIEKAITDFTPRIHARIPLQEESLVYILPLVEPSCLEKFMRSSIGQTLCKQKGPSRGKTPPKNKVL
jgi:hypothetical protein